MSQASATVLEAEVLRYSALGEHGRSVCRWKVGLEVRPDAGPAFEASAEVVLPDVIRINPGDGAVVAYEGERPGAVAIVEVADQRRQAREDWVAEHGTRAPAVVRERERTGEKGPKGREWRVVFAVTPEGGEPFEVTRKRWVEPRTWPRDAGIPKLGQAAIAVYDPADPASCEVFYTDPNAAAAEVEARFDADRRRRAADYEKLMRNLP